MNALKRILTVAFLTLAGLALPGAASASAQAASYPPKPNWCAPVRFETRYEDGQILRTTTRTCRGSTCVLTERIAPEPRSVWEVCTRGVSKRVMRPLS